MKTKQITRSLLPLLISTLLLFGCGDNDTNGSKQLSLTQGEPVLMNKGDTVIPQDENTQIEISHIVETDQRYVTLVTGNAIVQRAE